MMLKSAIQIVTCALGLSWAGVAMAQYLPGPQWGEAEVGRAEVIDVDTPPPPPETEEPTDPEDQRQAQELVGLSVSVEDLAGPMDYDDMLAINRLAASATVPVTATFRRDPLIMPQTTTLEGVATVVDVGDGRPVLITSLSLVDGAETIEIDWNGRTVVAEARSDARYGLAVLQPQRRLNRLPRALPLLPVGADTQMEIFSTIDGSVGATAGRAPDQYSFYQLTSLGATLGYPLVNRRGEVVGIGSHRYPVIPAFTLSIPSAAVRDFLEVIEE